MSTRTERLAKNPPAHEVLAQSIVGGIYRHVELQKRCLCSDCQNAMIGVVAEILDSQDPTWPLVDLLELRAKHFASQVRDRRLERAIELLDQATGPNLPWSEIGRLVEEGKALVAEHRSKQ